MRKRSETARRTGGRAQDALRGDLYAPQCPSRGVLEHVTSRWGVLALVALLEGGTHRFSALRRKVAGVSEKMLSQTLQALEADGFVQREVFPEVPPRVEYTLTPLGHEVAGRVKGLAEWIEANLGRILTAREQRPVRAPRREAS
ncbi:helix-turn-helix transcriptional regulator [Myxococcus sp. K15C18031901]|uniref:winged helix-turn-helix transcriptional regulator n=1 Tax=Myxococcus dinghuensis TaxID=2906761 RepID=UPI0020A703D5|nr:helix-turn-helix domain-containing protein [Myxococcus dinghuensis]MCP3097943.1 helix-turn-helix transcriptional regulator [Myxococcus dinghuensis]